MLSSVVDDKVWNSSEYDDLSSDLLFQESILKSLKTIQWSQRTQFSWKILQFILLDERSFKGNNTQSWTDLGPGNLGTAWPWPGVSAETLAGCGAAGIQRRGYILFAGAMIEMEVDEQASVSSPVDAEKLLLKFGELIVELYWSLDIELSVSDCASDLYLLWADDTTLSESASSIRK